MSDNSVNSNPSLYKVFITTDETSISVAQGVTRVVEVVTQGPQGPAGSGGESDPIFTAKSASLATTGSNTFKGNQIISGSGSNFILQVHGVNAEPWAFGIYNDTYSSSQPGLAGWVDNTGEANIGTEDDKPLYIYTDAAYNIPTLIISSSGVTVASKLTVNNGITGSLYGTSSWARSASYVLSSNVYGPNGFDSVNYATSAGTAATATELTSPATQNLIINGKFITQLNNTNLSSLAQNLHYYTGHTIYGPKGGGVSIGDLVYLETDYTWYQVDQTTDTSTKMLGIWVDDATGYVLLEGDIVLDQSYISDRDYGLPVFISGSARFTCNAANLTSGYIRTVGYPYYHYNDGLTIYNWILRFKPSNDWTQIS